MTALGLDPAALAALGPAARRDLLQLLDVEFRLARNRLDQLEQQIMDLLKMEPPPPKSPALGMGTPAAIPAGLPSRRSPPAEGSPPADLHRARIERLKREIAEGTYKPAERLRQFIEARQAWACLERG